MNCLEESLGSRHYVIDRDVLDLDVRSEEDPSAFRVDGSAHLEVRYGNARQTLDLRSMRLLHTGPVR